MWVGGETNAPNAMIESQMARITLCMCIRAYERCAHLHVHVNDRMHKCAKCARVHACECTRKNMAPPWPNRLSGHECYVGTRVLFVRTNIHERNPTFRFVPHLIAHRTFMRPKRPERPCAYANAKGSATSPQAPNEKKEQPWDP